MYYYCIVRPLSLLKPSSSQKTSTRNNNEIETKISGKTALHNQYNKKKEKISQARVNRIVLNFLFSLVKSKPIARFREEEEENPKTHVINANRFPVQNGIHGK